MVLANLLLLDEPTCYSACARHTSTASILLPHCLVDKAATVAQYHVTEKICILDSVYNNIIWHDSRSHKPLEPSASQLILGAFDSEGMPIGPRFCPASTLITHAERDLHMLGGNLVRAVRRSSASRRVPASRLGACRPRETSAESRPPGSNAQ